jgi:adenine-specific DNA-methyltransferase
MAIEYLGHKESLLNFLLEPIDRATRGQPHRVADIFCGTAAVSVALKKRGHTVVANDSLAMCATFAQAALLNDGEPPFHGIAGEIPCSRTRSPYRDVLRFLEALPPREGFITRNYSPRSTATGEHERRYFTEANALKIDAIRWQIQAWGDHLLPQERAVLLADLVRAANSVSNIAGTYGCYLKHWKARALTPLRLAPSAFVSGGAGHGVTCMDAAALAPAIDVEVVYADPPYTKRQYSAYYHVPETIVLDDAPQIDGSTGLRPWREKQSAWCYRRHAPAALTQLVASLRCEWFMLSYNEDGQICHDDIMDILGKHGTVAVYEKDSRRYKSANRPHRGSVVTERLYALRRGR